MQIKIAIHDHSQIFLVVTGFQKVGSHLVSATRILSNINDYIMFLNQARAGRRPARAWFLRIAFVREVSMRVCVDVCVCVCVCVCVSAPEAMNN